MRIGWPIWSRTNRKSCVDCPPPPLAADVFRSGALLSGLAKCGGEGTAVSHLRCCVAAAPSMFSFFLLGFIFSEPITWQGTQSARFSPTSTIDRLDVFRRRFVRETLALLGAVLSLCASGCAFARGCATLSRHFRPGAAFVLPPVELTHDLPFNKPNTTSVFLSAAPPAYAV